MGRVLTMDKTTTIETLLRQGKGIRAICRMVHSAPKVVIRLRDALLDRETPKAEVPTGFGEQRETVDAQVPTGPSTASPLDSWGYQEQEESPERGLEWTTRSTQLRPHLETVQGLSAGTSKGNGCGHLSGNTRAWRNLGHLSLLCLVVRPEFQVASSV